MAETAWLAGRRALVTGGAQGLGRADAILLAVKHDAIVELGADRLQGLLSEGGLIYDIKGVVPAELSDARI